MWARCTEVFLACWLAASPFVFGHRPGETALWATDRGAAFVVALLALLSLGRRTRRAHLFELPVAGYLVVSAWLAGGADPRAAHQNHVLVGLLLFMFAILPTDAHRPPPAWRDAGQKSSSQRA